eukprot:m.27746 g.27746  ORF g.27746 m.27746 type:complete len:149 (-) comp7930_c0_seq3:154-600(-)
MAAAVGGKEYTEGGYVMVDEECKSLELETSTYITFQKEAKIPHKMFADYYTGSNMEDNELEDAMGKVFNDKIVKKPFATIGSKTVGEVVEIVVKATSKGKLFIVHVIVKYKNCNPDYKYKLLDPKRIERKIFNTFECLRIFVCREEQS